MSHKTISPLRLYLCFLLFTLAVLTTFRVAFWIFASQDMPDPLSPDCWRAFYIGFRFDARISALFTLPLGVLLAIPWTARRLHRASWLIFAVYGLLFLGLISVYCVDFGFYAYLKVRLNAVLFELLEDLKVAMKMVWQSYPVPAIVLGAVVGAALCAKVFRLLAAIPAQPSPSRVRRGLGFLAGFIVFALATYGQVNSSLFPLRWSYAFFTTDGAVIALGLNPVQSLYDTYGASTEGNYSLEKTQAAYPRMARILQVARPDGQSLNYDRSTVAAAAATPPNVVIIVMESLAYPKTSFAPGNDDPTPELKALAARSMLFRRFFANARTTARAIFTIMTGVPDVNDSGTGSRNPFVADQRVIANEFEGYDKYYMIGGNTAWANIRAVLSHNVTGLNILEDAYWRSPPVDVWGISDLDLFREAHDIFRRHDPKKPFLAVIQTSSFHKPYTIPPTPRFTVKTLTEENQRNYGFVSEDEYNSLRYADFALGSFMRMAEAAPYYNNTIFFIFGDHGLNDHSANMPAGYNAADVAPWHVPLLIHASPALGKIQPGVSDMLCSHVDIFPTAASLAGIGYTNHTLGRDIFDRRFDGSRAVYIGGKSDTSMRMLLGNYCLYDNRTGRQFLYRLDSQDASDLSAAKPEEFQKLRQLGEDFDETARYMLYHNKKNAKR